MMELEWNSRSMFRMEIALKEMASISHHSKLVIYLPALILLLNIIKSIHKGYYQEYIRV